MSTELNLVGNLYLVLKKYHRGYKLHKTQCFLFHFMFSKNNFE